MMDTCLLIMRLSSMVDSAVVTFFRHIFMGTFLSRLCFYYVFVDLIEQGICYVVESLQDSKDEAKRMSTWSS